MSRDGSTAYTSVSYKVAADALTDAGKQNLQDVIDRAEEAGLTVEARGSAVSGSVGAGGIGEAVGVAVAALVLLITFGSPAAAGVPLLTAVLGVGISTASIMALGSAFGLSPSTGSLASMLGLAVGIDYAVFVIARYRQERAKGHDAEVTALAANGRSNTEIVESLALSPLTVRTHIQRAMNKLDARDRAQLVVMAYQSGLVRPGPPPNTG